MGIGWVQVYENSIQHTFSAPIQNWPSSYKAELIAILSAICTCPRGSIIQIYTDSQSIISKYTKITTHPPNINKIYSHNYWPIWQTLLNLIKSYSLKITLYKITAHSNNIFNDLADSLAKHHNTLSQPNFLDFKHNNLYNPSYLLQYDNHYIEQPTRRTIKNICNAHIVSMWSSQNRIQNIIPISGHIDWNATWLYLNNNHKRTYNYTNFQLSQSKTFRIKNLLNSLPTLSHFHNLYPNIYTNINCISCNTYEHSYHWIICPNSTPISSIISQTITQTLTPNSIDLSEHQLSQLHYLLLQLPCLSPNTPNPANHPDFYTTIRGYIPKAIIDSINTYTNSHKAALNITIKFLLKLSHNIYEQIWKPYCTNLSNWKKIHNIPHRIQPPTSSTQSTHTTSRLRIQYTYNCICGLPDQKHIETNTCPPLGLARRKINIWSDMWIKYSTSTNQILNIQI